MDLRLNEDGAGLGRGRMEGRIKVDSVSANPSSIELDEMKKLHEIRFIHIQK